MKYDDIPAPMREALGTYEMLRRIGFKPEEVTWHLNPDHMMLASLQTQGKEFDIRCGILDARSPEAHLKRWTEVITAYNNRQIPDEDCNRLLVECDAYRMTDEMLGAMRAKGIRVPVVDNA